MIRLKHLLTEQDNLKNLSAAALTNAFILRDPSEKRISVKIGTQFGFVNQISLEPIPPIDIYSDGDMFTLEYSNQTFEGIVTNGDVVFDVSSLKLVAARKHIASIRISGLGPST